MTSTRNERYLLLFDANNIKDYVFTTGRLKEVRGASEIVRKATTPKAIKDLSGLRLTDYVPATKRGNIVFAAGGSGLLLLNSEAEAIKAQGALERHYTDKTLTSSLSAAYEPWNGEEGESFQKAMQRVAASLRIRKARRGPEPATMAGGAVAFCESCRQEPVKDGEPGDTSRLLGASCLQKHEASKDVRDSIRARDYWRAFTGKIQPPPASGEMPWEIKKKWEDEARLNPQNRDFGTIGAYSNPSGYIGFVYADGDRMGSKLEKVASPAEYHALSKAIEDAVEIALGIALRQVYAWNKRDGWRAPDERNGEKQGHPFEIIAVGGDDVIAITTADGALPLAAAYSIAFTEQMQAIIAQEPLLACLNETAFTTSVGVMIAHDTMPVITLRDRAKELLRLAKRKQREMQRKQKDQEGPQEGVIDFQIASTPSLDTISNIRSSEYKFDDKTVIVARPYPVSRLENLLKLARELELPNSKRADLYASLFQPRLNATLDTFRIHSRLNQDTRAKLLEIARDFGWVKYYPFGKNTDNEFFTGLADLLEVMELVAAKEQA